MRLYNTYTQLLILKNIDKTAMSWPIQNYGIECGDGWFDIIEDALRKLQKIDNLKCFRITQIKAKGGLQIKFICIHHEKLSANYTYPGYLVTDVAERQSLKICEICGQPGKLRTIDNFSYVSCEEHKKNGLS